MLISQAAKALIGWKSVSSRIFTAKFHTKIGKATIIQCYAPTNEADDVTKTDFYERLKGVINGVARKDLILLLRDYYAKVGSNNTSFETVMGNQGLGKMNTQDDLGLARRQDREPEWPYLYIIQVQKVKGKIYVRKC